MYIDVVPNWRIRNIADHYELKRQIGKLIEETAELTEAAKGAEDELLFGIKEEISREKLDALVDEMADVLVMIDQISYLLDVRVAVDERMNYKISRQVQRMIQEEKAAQEAENET